jgi:thiamine thiazole synthase
MMISGQKAAHLALKALGLPNEIDGNYKPNVHPELVLASTDDETASA